MVTAGAGNGIVRRQAIVIKQNPTQRDAGLTGLSDLERATFTVTWNSESSKQLSNDLILVQESLNTSSNIAGEIQNIGSEVATNVQITLIKRNSSGQVLTFGPVGSISLIHFRQKAQESLRALYDLMVVTRLNTTTTSLGDQITGKLPCFC